jgi:L-fuconolactonase
VPAFCARHARHWLVLDHLGKPAVGGSDDDAWLGQLHELAQLPHVLCKLSGLVTETGGRPVVAGELHRYLDAALELFGPQRLMFGSDWPVCLLNAEYSDVVDIVATWSSRLSEEEQAALWGGTAARCYGLRVPAATEMR